MVWEKEKFREEKVRSLIITLLEFVNEGERIGLGVYGHEEF